MLDLSVPLSGDSLVPLHLRVARIGSLDPLSQRANIRVIPAWMPRWSTYLKGSLVTTPLRSRGPRPRSKRLAFDSGSGRTTTRSGWPLLPRGAAAGRPRRSTGGPGRDPYRSGPVIPSPFSSLPLAASSTSATAPGDHGVGRAAEAFPAGRVASSRMLFGPSGR